MIIIFGALKIELLPLLRSLQIKNTYRSGKTIIHNGSGKDWPITIIQTGMGPENAGRAAEFFKDNYTEWTKGNSSKTTGSTEVIMIGFCGATDRRIKAGDKVVYSSIKNIDHTDEKGFRQNGILKLNRQNKSGSLSSYGFIDAAGASVPKVITDPAVKKKLNTDLNIQAIDMESYWIGKAALEMNLPFSCIRVVSDGALDILPSYYTKSPGLKMAASIILSFLKSIFNRDEYMANLNAFKNLRKANLQLARLSTDLISGLRQ